MSSIRVAIHQSGTSFPASGRGRVFSSHAKALNLAFDDDAELATLVTEEQLMTVSSLLVSAAAADLRLATIDRGRAVEVHEGQLSFDSGLMLMFDASAARSFDGRIEPMRSRRRDSSRPGSPRPTPSTTTPLAVPRPRSPRPAQSLIDDLLEAVGGDTLGGHGEARAASPGVGLAPLAVAMRGGRPYPSEPPGADPFARGAWKVVRPILSGDIEPDALLDRAFSLVGLGGGFTPSGDDFLVGMLAARALLGEPSPAGASLERLLGRCSATTLPGATILRQALRGCFPAYLCRFARGFAALGTGAG
ncbi:MAG: DUF2877 domain-containing protein, partial [Spirochaetota bacterium]